MKKIAILLLSILVSLPVSVFAQVSLDEILSGKVPGTAVTWFQLIFGPNTPTDIFTTEKFFQFFLFPFIAVWMIMYGILSEIRIFTRATWVQGVLALLIGLIASSSGILWVTVQFFFTTGGLFGTVMFGVLLLVGIFLWGASKFWGWGFRGRGSGGFGGLLRRSREALDYDAQIQRLENEMRRLRYAADSGIMDKVVAASEIQKFLTAIAELEKKKREISGDLKKEIERPHAGVS